MEYLPPKELAKKYWKSLKTIYNWLQRHSDKIQTKTEFWKTVVNCKDFEKVFSNYNPNYKKTTENNVEASSQKQEPNFEKLQNDYNYSMQKIEDLEKFNSTLSNQVKEYAVLFTEEKREKKDILDKLESLNQKYTQKVEEFGNEKIRMTKKQVSFIGFSAFLSFLIIRLQFSEILDILWKIVEMFK
jgi:hypothetical protein